jgi:hypothetical protein
MRESSRERVTATKQLVYTESFKQFVKEHPGAVAEAEKLITTALDTRNDGLLTSEDGTVSVERLKRNPAPAFELRVGDERFFVKCEGFYSKHGGYNEFKSNEVAQELLKKLPNVEVVPAQLGFSDARQHYFVAKWQGDMQEAMYYLYTPDRHKISLLEQEELKKRVVEIQQALGDFVDVSDHNMFYDPETKKIFVFDLHRLSDEKS